MSKFFTKGVQLVIMKHKALVFFSTVILILLISGFFFQFDVSTVNAQVLNNTQLCINSNTQQVNTSVQIGSSGSYSILNTSVPTFCNTGCSKLTNSCRPDFSIQVFEVLGITGAFIVVLLLGIFLSDYIPFLDVVVTVLIGVIAAIIGLTDLFSSNLGYVFFAESILFIISTFIIAWRTYYT